MFTEGSFLYLLVAREGGDGRVLALILRVSVKYVGKVSQPVTT